MHLKLFSVQFVDISVSRLADSTSVTVQSLNVRLLCTVFSLPDSLWAIQIERGTAHSGSVNADETALAIGQGDEKQRLLGASGDREQEGNMRLNIRVRRQVNDYLGRCCTISAVKGKLPITRWLPKYSCGDFQSDLIAGLTVGLTVIPQGLAYAVIAGLEPQYGLYSAFMGCFVYMIFGTSKDITLGPTAIMSLMTGIFATSPVNQDPTLAIVLTLMCGVVQLLLGVLNLGILVNYISHPVINSFTSAAAITIGFGQVKHILGLSNIPRDFLHMVYETFAKIPHTNKWDLVMGLVSMLLLYLLKKFRTIKWGDESPTGHEPELPMSTMVARKIVWLTGTGANAIVVISAAALTAALLSNNIDVITITGHIQSGLPSFEPPKFSSSNMTVSEVFSHIGAGFIIVPFLGLVESIAIGKAFARVNNYKIDPTQELIAIGAANILSSFVHSYPVTGSFSRTAVNSQSGVRTPASGLFTGSLILLSLGLLLPYCYYIPKSALAAVIIMAVMQMVDYKIVPVLWRTNKWDLFVHFVTFVCSLCVGIEYGILIGIGLSLLILLYPMARPHLTVTTERNVVIIQPDQGLFFPAIEYVESEVFALVLASEPFVTTERNVVIIQPDQGLFFPAIEYVESQVFALALASEMPRAVILDMLHISGLDFSSLHGIRAMLMEGERRGICIILCQVNVQVTVQLVQEDIPGIKMCSSVAEALEELSNKAQCGGGEEDPFVVHLA